MSSKEKNIILVCISTFFSVFAILLAIRSIFDDDSDKIISKKGQEILNDSDKMKDLKEKLKKSKSEDQHNEIYI